MCVDKLKKKSFKIVAEYFYSLRYSSTYGSFLCPFLVYLFMKNYENALKMLIWRAKKYHKIFVIKLYFQSTKSNFMTTFLWNPLYHRFKALPPFLRKLQKRPIYWAVSGLKYFTKIVIVTFYINMLYIFCTESELLGNFAFE